MNPLLTESSTPLLHSTSSGSSSDADDQTPATSKRFNWNQIQLHCQFLSKSPSEFHTYRPLAILTGHIGSVSCLALCGEFILSASQGRDIIVWQQPDLRVLTRFGHGEGSVKSVVAVGSRVFTAHQDGRIRVWKVSRRSENSFRLINTLPTTKDYLGKFMKQSNYVQTRRHHKILWIEHADSISCLAVHNGLIYSGSWDKTLKIWRVSDLKCLESIKAHDDAINGIVACNGIVYSASADGKIKAWGRSNRRQNQEQTQEQHSLMGILEGHKEVSMNSVVVSNDGKWVYGGISDGFLMGWEKSENSSMNWRLVCEKKAHQMAVLCVCLKGEYLCSGSADKSIGVWRREAFGKLSKVLVINGHQGPIKCLQAAAPNGVGEGFLLYSGSFDKTLRVWWLPKLSSSSSYSSSSMEVEAFVADDSVKSIKS